MQGARPFGNRLLQFFHRFLIYAPIGQKAFHPHELAHMWVKDFLTRKKTAEAFLTSAVSFDPFLLPFRRSQECSVSS